MLLSNSEKSDLARDAEYALTDKAFDAIEAAVIAKLCAGGEWPKAFDGVYEEGQWHRVYIKEQIKTMIAAATARERERCAKVCDRFAEREMHPAECAAAIRGEQT